MLSFYQALRLPSDRAAATAFIRARAAAHRRWISARSRPVPVSPTPGRWLQGQLKFLTQQSPTGPGELREAQIRDLIASDGIKPRTASLPPTVPAQDRHPWAGFPASRPLVLASIGVSQRLLHDIKDFTPAWCALHPKDLRTLPDVRPDVLLVDASLDGQNKYGCSAYELFAGAVH